MVKEHIKEKVQGVEGWLSFLIFSLVVSCVLNFIFGIADISSIFENQELSYIYLYGLTFLDILLFGGIIGFAIYVIYSLVKLKPNAVSLGKMYFILTFLSNLIGVIFSSVTGEPLASENSFFGSSQIIFRSLVFSLIWFLYLTYSTRVNNTYPKEKRKSYMIDKILFFSILAIPLVIFSLAFVGKTFENQLNSPIQNVELKRTLAENEYSDGRIFFIKPPYLEITKNYTGVVPFFILSKDEEMSITLVSDLVDVDHKKYFDEFYNGSFNSLRQDYELDYTIIKEDQSTNANGFEYFNKSIRINGEEIYIWTVIVIFDNNSNKIAGIGYFAPQNKNSVYSSYLDEVTNSIKFS